MMQIFILLLYVNNRRTETPIKNNIEFNTIMILIYRFVKMQLKSNYYNNYDHYDDD